MTTAEQDFFENYLRQSGGNAEGALFAVLAEINESAQRLRDASTCAMKCPGIPDDQMEKLVEAAAELAAIKAVELINANFYQSVGKTFVQKFLYVIGGLTVVGFTWLKAKGII